MSDEPTHGFRYGGVLISGCDMGISRGKAPERPLYYTANNHGSIINIKGDWHVFYHRHTNGVNYARQGCFERITLTSDGRFEQAEITSCGS